MHAAVYRTPAHVARDAKCGIIMRESRWVKSVTNLSTVIINWFIRKTKAALRVHSHLQFIRRELSVKNGLYFTKWVHSYLLFGQLLHELKSSIMICGLKKFTPNKAQVWMDRNVAKMYKLFQHTWHMGCFTERFSFHSHKLTFKKIRLTLAKL